MNNPRAASVPQAPATMRRKVLVNFGLFAVFFLFYLGAAVIQTPACASIAAVPVMGMPLGLLLSLAIFPVSWIIMVIWFLKAR
jgi:uncharacterized membrane protein (DUF485 family)